jgi:hypothetical protein
MHFDSGLSDEHVCTVKRQVVVDRLGQHTVAVVEEEYD